MSVSWRWLFLCSLVGVLSLTAWAGEPTTVTGESLVLAGTEPGVLWFDQVDAQSVVVRSSYIAGQDNTVVYDAGRDYVVDAGAGTIARTSDSRIPDYSTNILYGQRDFDHSKFPGFGNTPFFVFVDYTTNTGEALCVPTDQSALLKKTHKRLEAGGPFKLLVYGDSISAGGDATAKELRFQQRYADWLRARFPQADITVENGATGGDTTRNGLQRLEEKVFGRAPDLVLMGFGMNDHNVNSVPLDEFRQNLLTLIGTIREKTGAEVLLFSTFPPNPNWKFGSHRMADYAATTREAAAEAGCAFADVYTAWAKLLQRKDCASLLGNNINHPNDFGHWVYFEALKSVRF